MKNKILFITFLCFMILSVAKPLSHPIDISHHSEEIKLKSPSIKYWGGALDDVYNYDALHYEIHLNLTDTLNETISGNTILSLKTTANNFSQAIFDLHDDLNIETIVYSDENISNLNIDLENDVNRTNNRVYVTLPNTLNNNKEFSLDVHYNGPAIVSNSFGYTNGMVFDNSNGSYCIYTMSEPQESRYWFPCKDIPNDKVTVDFYATHYDYQTAVSNGTLKSITKIKDNLKISHWQEIHPIAVYLIAITVSNFEKIEDTYTSLDSLTQMPVNYYLFPGQYTPNKAAIDLTPAAIHCYASKYGEYPYLDEKYGMVSMSQGGGMEHQTCSTMGSYPEGTIVHELAHQWFGDLITCATWQDTWINEGGATYSEAIWYENTYGEEFLETYMKQILTSSAFDLTPVTDQNYALTLTVYHKGAWIYNMLRYLLGDDVFFQTVQKLLHNSQYSYNSLTSEQFINYFANESGIDLSTFYDQWVVKGGYPIYDFSYLAYNTENNESVLKIKGNQTQEVTSIRPIFEMPIPIKVDFMDGSDSILIVNNTQQLETFEFDFNKKIKTNIPLSSFNYGSKILCKTKTSSYIDETTIVNENFENSTLPNGWTVIDEDGDGNSWILKSNSSAHSGMKYTECKSSNTQSSDWLISPSIHLNGFGQIAFFIKSKGSTVLESFKLKISDSGNSIDDFDQEFGNFIDVSNEWTSYFINLGSEYANKDIYIAWQGVSFNKYKLCLDDITIYDSGAGIGDDLNSPKNVILYQNYPNPFNPSTTIKFYTNQKANVFLNIYNIKGELVKELIKNTKFKSGYHSICLDGKDLSSGTYFYELKVNGQVSKKRMLLVK